MNKQEASKGNKPYPIRTMLITLIAIMALSAAGCTLFPSSSKPTPEPVLSETQQKLLDIIYNNRSVWETSDVGGVIIRKCYSISIEKRDNYTFLLCAHRDEYKYNNENEGGYIVIYVVDSGSGIVRPATGEDTIGRITGYGISTAYSKYNVNSSDTEKYNAVKRMISGFNG